MAGLTQEYLKKILKYDPETGEFVWLVSPASQVKVGDIAGTRDKGGYTLIQINYKLYKAHRLAYLYMNGYWPEGDMDHIDQNKSNNSWSNLRAASRSNNMANRPKQKNNTSGYKGVGWHSQLNKWRARIRYNQKLIHIGLFDCKHEAAKAYNKKSIELFGEFAFINEIDA